jgi:hypothetical protein
LEENSLLKQSNKELKEEVQTLKINIQELEREHKHVLKALQSFFEEYEKIQTLNELLSLRTRQLEFELEAEKKLSEAAAKVINELRQMKGEPFVPHLKKHPHRFQLITGFSIEEFEGKQRSFGHPSNLLSSLSEA